MPLLTVTDLHKSHGTRLLFAGVSFGVEDGEKVGFIGPNGAGKSTLLRIVAGLEAPDRGVLAMRRGATVGFLPQEPELAAGETIRSAVGGGRPGMRESLDEYYAVAAEIAASTDPPERLLLRQGELMSKIEALGGWHWMHEVERVLTQLDLTSWDRDVEALSGGEKKRVALGRVLLDAPDLLLLDEPTNHLDADTTRWLEEWLLDYAGAVMLVTHDRYFLDRAVSRMIEVTPRDFASYDGGYTEYLEAKAEREAREATAAAKRDKLVEQELAWVKRSPAARTGKQKARIKRLDAARAESDADRPSSDMELRFGPPPRLGRTVLELEDVSKSYAERTLIRGLTTRLRAGERIGVIGPNGAGKTTLLRLVLGLEQPDSGTVRLGANTRVAYFDQQRADLDPSRSVYEAVANEEWVEFGGRRVHLRSYLESFLFPTAVQDQRVGSLSGGERNRVMLARFLLQEANLLVLDEPTNDLDLPTLRVLESALADFGGCVLVVSHDRFFLDKVATGLLVFERDGVVHRHEGGYDLYRRLKEEAARAAAAAEPKEERTARKAAERKDAPRARRLTYQERRELEGMEAAILAAEERRDEIGVQLTVPALYVDTPGKVAELRAELAEVEALVESLYARWAELEEIASTG
jgi:ABC transport system ATP-binding/permease protein